MKALYISRDFFFVLTIISAPSRRGRFYNIGRIDEKHIHDEKTATTSAAYQTLPQPHNRHRIIRMRKY